MFSAPGKQPSLHARIYVKSRIARALMRRIGYLPALVLVDRPVERDIMLQEWRDSTGKVLNRIHGTTIDYVPTLIEPRKVEQE